MHNSYTPISLDSSTSVPAIVGSLHHRDPALLLVLVMVVNPVRFYRTLRWVKKRHRQFAPLCPNPASAWSGTPVRMCSSDRQIRLHCTSASPSMDHVHCWTFLNLVHLRLSHPCGELGSSVQSGLPYCCSRSQHRTLYFPVRDWAIPVNICHSTLNVASVGSGQPRQGRTLWSARCYSLPRSTSQRQISGRIVTFFVTIWMDLPVKFPMSFLDLSGVAACSTPALDTSQWFRNQPSSAPPPALRFPWYPSYRRLQLAHLDSPPRLDMSTSNFVTVLLSLLGAKDPRCGSVPVPRLPVMSGPLTMGSSCFFTLVVLRRVSQLAMPKPPRGSNQTGSTFKFGLGCS